MSHITGREPAIVKMVARSEKGTRRLSLNRLGSFIGLLAPDSVSIDALAEAIHGDDPTTRFNAARALAQRKDRESRHMMEHILKTGRVVAKASIARHLHELTWYAARPLAIIALNDRESRVRESAVYALCRFHERGAYELLAEKLDGDDDYVLAAAAYALRDTQNPGAVPILKHVMGAIDPEVRMKGLEALSATIDNNAIPLVKQSLTDPDPDVQYAAVLTLLELIDAEAIPDLLDQLDNVSGKSFDAVLRGVFHATNYLKIDIESGSIGERFIRILEQGSCSEFSHTRHTVLHPLAWSKHPHAVQILLNMYEREVDQTVKAEAVHIVSSLMSDAADLMLEDAVHSDMPAVREAAERVLWTRKQYNLPQYDPTAAEGIGMVRPHLGR